jgi:hypothetical protein
MRATLSWIGFSRSVMPSAMSVAAIVILLPVFPSVASESMLSPAMSTR